MENQAILKNNPKQEKNNTKKIILIVATSVIFLALLAFLIFVAVAPVKVKFSTPGIPSSFNSVRVITQDDVEKDENLTDEDIGKVKETPNINTLNNLREHYTFVGWFKDYKKDKDTSEETFSNKIDFETETFDKTTTVYGYWEPTEYKITYIGVEEENLENLPESYNVFHDPNQKDRQMNNEVWNLTPEQLTEKTRSYKLVITEPTKDGYTFGGWIITYTDPESGRTVTEENTNKLNSIRMNPVGEITLEAIWL